MIWVQVLLSVYFLVLGFLAANGLYRLCLAVIVVRRSVRTRDESGVEDDRDVDAEELPRVLVQVPIYNEALVAARVIDAVAQLEYPVSKLEIQILDDSVDETCEVVDRSRTRHRRRGVPIDVVRRGNRAGYKAGALAHGLSLSAAELVAVFDADFIPDPKAFCFAQYLNLWPTNVVAWCKRAGGTSIGRVRC